MIEAQPSGGPARKTIFSPAADRVDRFSPNDGPAPNVGPCGFAGPFPFFPPARPPGSPPLLKTFEPTEKNSGPENLPFPLRRPLARAFTILRAPIRVPSLEQCPIHAPSTPEKMSLQLHFRRRIKISPCSFSPCPCPSCLTGAPPPFALLSPLSPVIRPALLESSDLLSMSPNKSSPLNSGSRCSPLCPSRTRKSAPAN